MLSAGLNHREGVAFEGDNDSCSAKGCAEVPVCGSVEVRFDGVELSNMIAMSKLVDLVLVEEPLRKEMVGLEFGLFCQLLEVSGHCFRIFVE